MRKIWGNWALLLPREVGVDDRAEFAARGRTRNPSSKLARTLTPLGIATGVLSHQDRAFVLPKAMTNQLVVVQHQLPLFGQGRAGGDRLAAERRPHLAKQPGPVQGGSSDHDAIARVGLAGGQHR